MRSHFTKALVIVLLAAFFGTPWGLYNERYAEDAQAMSQEQWLELMEYTQEAAAHGTGLVGTFIVTLILFTAFVCIYEFIKLWAGMLVNRVMGPDAGRGI